jgi:uncharacterized membrane protein YeaQ/YmgE (transglycosylase-associated protein family)
LGFIPEFVRALQQFASGYFLGMNIIAFLVVGILAGWLAGKIMKGRGFGLVGNLVVGIVGAIAGGFIFRILNIHAYGLIGSVVTATVGAIVLLYLAAVLTKG